MAISLSWASILGIASACSRRSPVWARQNRLRSRRPLLPPSSSTDCCRAAADHGHVLRSRRLDQPCGEARRGGLAQPGRRLSRRGLGRGDRSRRPRAEEARRRADGAVRLSARAGERRRASGARRARHPARARRPQRQERPVRRAGAFRPHRHRHPVLSWSTRPAKCSARRRTSPRACRRRPNRGRCSSPRACSGRRPGCSSPKTRARTSLKGVPAPVTLYRIVRASGGRRGGARTLTPLVGREDELAPAPASLVARAGRRRPVRPDRRRAGHRQIAPRRGVPRKTRRDAAHLGRMVVVAALAEYPAAPDRGMGPAAVRRADRPPNSGSPISKTLWG